MALREKLSMADIRIRVKQGDSEKFRILGFQNIHFSIHDLFDTQVKEVKQWVQ